MNLQTYVKGKVTFLKPSEVLNVLNTLGVTEVDDLSFIKEDDLIPKFGPVKGRRLAHVLTTTTASIIDKYEASDLLTKRKMLVEVLQHKMDEVLLTHEVVELSLDIQFYGNGHEEWLSTFLMGRNKMGIAWPHTDRVYYNLSYHLSNVLQLTNETLNEKINYEVFAADIQGNILEGQQKGAPHSNTYGELNYGGINDVAFIFNLYNWKIVPRSKTSWWSEECYERLPGRSAWADFVHDNYLYCTGEYYDHCSKCGLHENDLD